MKPTDIDYLQTKERCEKLQARIMELEEECGLHEKIHEDDEDTINKLRKVADAAREFHDSPAGDPKTAKKYGALSQALSELDGDNK